jgi:polyphosphate kinase
MNKNIYRRIEVCVPIHDAILREQIIKIINIQLADNVQAVMVDSHSDNINLENTTSKEIVRSQQALSKLF